MHVSNYSSPLNSKSSSTLSLWQVISIGRLLSIDVSLDYPIGISHCELHLEKFQSQVAPLYHTLSPSLNPIPTIGNIKIDVLTFRILVQS